MSSQTLPGRQVGRSVTPRRILRQAGRDHVIQIGGTLDGTNSYDGKNTSYEKYIRAGWILAYNSTTKLWAPCKRTQVNGTSGAVTEVVVDDASAFKIGDVVTIGADTTITVTDIDYATDTFTIASTTVADNEVVFAENGFATPAGILLDDEVALWDEEKINNVNKTAQILKHGFVDESQVLGDLAACLAVTNKLNHIIFDETDVAP